MMENPLYQDPVYKVAVQELGRRGAIHWGLATSLKYEMTMEFIVELLKQIEKFHNEFRMANVDEEVNNEIC